MGPMLTPVSPVQAKYLEVPNPRSENWGLRDAIEMLIAKVFCRNLRILPASPCSFGKGL